MGKVGILTNFKTKKRGDKGISWELFTNIIEQIVQSHAISYRNQNQKVISLKMLSF